MDSLPYETVVNTGMKRLYRYERFKEEYLASTLGGQVHFSNPDDFNDPWDCKPWFNLPDDLAERERLIEWLDRASRTRTPLFPKNERAVRIAQLRADPSLLGTLLGEFSKSMCAAMARQYRICSLTTKPACPLMWAHYGDKHRGICLEFDVWKEDLCSAIKVQYRETYPMYSVLEDDDISPFYIKSAEWAYEDEYRLVAEEEGTAFRTETLKTRNHMYSLPKGSLKSVIVGASAAGTTRERIEALVSQIAPDVIVRQATCFPDRYQLAITPPLDVA